MKTEHVIFLGSFIVGAIVSSLLLSPGAGDAPKPDFVMDSPTVISNAAHHGYQLPEGYGVVCDQYGRYAPSIISIGAVITTDGFVRTSRWEAVIAAWRCWEVLHPQPVVSTNPIWSDCK